MADRKRLTKLRETIEKLRTERREVEQAPVDLGTAIAAMRSRLHTLGDAFRPSLGGYMRHHKASPDPMFNEHELEAFLGWALRERLGDSLEEALREQYETIALALLPGEREKRLGELDDQLLTLERQEEGVVRKLESEGIDVLRRAGVSVEAVLDVR